MKVSTFSTSFGTYQVLDVADILGLVFWQGSVEL